MKTVKRKSADACFSMCVQPAFLIGTTNENGSHNFAPITWVSITYEKENEYLLVISMTGRKRTRMNIQRTGLLSVNLVSTDMLEMMDYLGTHHADDGTKNEFPFAVGRGTVIDIPVLDTSRWVYECEVAYTTETGCSTTFFCRIRNIQIDETLDFKDTFSVDLTQLDPVVYSGMYHSIGKLLGKIGDFQ